MLESTTNNWKRRLLSFLLRKIDRNSRRGRKGQLQSAEPRRISAGPAGQGTGSTGPGTAGQRSVCSPVPSPSGITAGARTGHCRDAAAPFPSAVTERNHCRGTAPPRAGPAVPGRAGPCRAGRALPALGRFAMGQCLPCLGDASKDVVETPDPEIKRRQLAEAAEKRQMEASSRGIKNAYSVEQKKKKQEEIERRLAASRPGGEGGLRWQVG
nr:small VCP/p97-interacting protein [Taeniopygia guttata]